jgi:SAM-dependent methyltransferase
MPSTGADTAAFYDDLAPFYHLLYQDWEASIARQGTALAGLLGHLGVASGSTVLDAACGVGTQALGLLQNGFRVVASDISPRAIDRLKRELESRALRAEARVDDMRRLSGVEPASVSAVIACDNSVPHLLCDDDVLQAFRSFHRCLRPGGWAVMSVRDYASLDRIDPDVRPYGLRREGGRRFLAVQVWEWEGDQYDLGMYLTTELPNGACETRVIRTRYYAISIARLMDLLAQAGFCDIRRRDDVLFQPVVIARRPNGA